MRGLSVYNGMTEKITLCEWTTAYGNETDGLGLLAPSTLQLPRLSRSFLDVQYFPHHEEQHDPTNRKSDWDVSPDVTGQHEPGSEEQRVKMWKWRCPLTIRTRPEKRCCSNISDIQHQLTLYMMVGMETTTALCTEGSKRYCWIPWRLIMGEICTTSNCKV